MPVTVLASSGRRLKWLSSTNSGSGSPSGFSNRLPSVVVN